MDNYNIRSRTGNNAVEIEGSLHNAINIRLTEVIQASDPRAKDPRMKEEIAAKIRDLVCRGPFKVVLRAEIPPSANVLTARYVLAIKHNITGEVKFKARYVI